MTLNKDKRVKQKEEWLPILPKFLYGLGVKMWGKEYMKKRYLKDEYTK